MENGADNFSNTKRTWYGGRYISPSIIQVLQSYERIIEKLSRSEEIETGKRCYNSCCYRKCKQETARFITLVDACLSTPNLMTKEEEKFSFISESNKNMKTTDFENICSDRPYTNCDPTCPNFQISDREPTNLSRECSVENKVALIPDDIKRTCKDININIEVKLKKKKKKQQKKNPKCECKKKRDEKIEQLPECNIKSIKKRKCMCVASEPITIIDLQPQKKEKFKFLKIFNFCKKEKESGANTTDKNIFVHTSKPLKDNELENIIGEKPMTYTERKCSENEDDISVFKIKDALMRRQITDIDNYPKRASQDQNNSQNYKKNRIDDPYAKINNSQQEKITVQVFPSETNRKISVIRMSKGSEQPRSISENDNKQDKLQIKHVDSRFVNRRRLSNPIITESSPRHENTEENIIQLSKRSRKSSDSRINRLKLEIEQKPIFYYDRIGDWLISPIIPTNMFFKIFNHTLFHTDCCSYYLYIRIISNCLNKSNDGVKSDFNYKNYYVRFDGGYRGIPKRLRIQHIYRVNVNQNKYLVNKGRLKISYNAFLYFIVVFFHILYLIILVYFIFF
ncbi:uncharacterized protein LOC130892489 [Diorhabda carinulata]|uniref:uncharacterized protein LOC130892489 n=1 Tax=Diorhabda carinulata TaxID=1163345 RepID=UPI00259FF67E|nr:uncharacterized protein LOC130892489 [Diorhabda carinulata]